MVKSKIQKITAIFMCILFCASLEFGYFSNSDNLKNTYATSNEEIIYNFLKTELGLNTAAACGVLANIEKESNFKPNLLEGGYTWSSGGGYGICQWTNTPRTSSTGRRTNLVNFCNSNGYDYTTLTGQLYFLKYELEKNVKPGVYSYLKGVSNDAQGAYDAGYKWCYSFEVPAGYNTGVSVTRGNLARNKYWPKYGNTTDPDADNIITGDYFPVCDSSYTSIVEALKSIGAESSYEYRKKIAVANGISNYSGTSSQNVQLLNLLKAGTLKVPTDSDVVVVPSIDYSNTYYPACSSSYTSIVDALNSIGIDSSYSHRKSIAEKNGISDYSGTSSQNVQLLNLLKAGTLINPDATTTTTSSGSDKYFPSCSSSYTSIVDALGSIGVDSSYSYRKSIAEKNGISDYSGTSSQNVQLLNLLKAGQLIRPEYVEQPVISNYTVTLDAKGGQSAVSSLTVSTNGTYAGLVTPSREGYSFTGWFTDSGVQVSDGSTIVSNSDHTLYAHWTANTYTVSFDRNDGSDTVSSKSVVYDSTYGEMESPSRTGYTFLGWYTDVSGGTQVNSDNKFNTADNQTLYAHWSANKYEISFNLNGGTGDISSKVVEYDGIYGELETPENDGYEFNGWYTEEENGTQITSETRVTVTSEQTLYAQWIPIPSENTELNIDVSQTTLTNGQQYQITANQENLTYKSNNANVAVVSSKGVVTAVGEGTAVISVINSDYDVVQLKVTVVGTGVTGDANGDGTVDIADVVTISAYVGDAEKNPLTEQQIANADVHATGNGINANDALVIQQYLANIIESL